MQTGRKAPVYAGAALYVHVSSKAGACGPRVGLAACRVGTPARAHLSCCPITVHKPALSVGGKRQEGAGAIKTGSARGRPPTPPFERLQPVLAREPRTPDTGGRTDFQGEKNPGIAPGPRTGGLLPAGRKRRRNGGTLDHLCSPRLPISQVRIRQRHRHRRIAAKRIRYAHRGPIFLKRHNAARPGLVAESDRQFTRHDHPPKRTPQGTCGRPGNPRSRHTKGPPTGFRRALRPSGGG